ncbi:hypothetical protein Ancab_038788 [Ancistrocladus abbreviatus]
MKFAVWHNISGVCLRREMLGTRKSSTKLKMFCRLHGKARGRSRTHPYSEQPMVCAQHDFRSYEENGADEVSIVSAEGSIVLAEDDSIQGSSRWMSSSTESEEHAAFLVHPDAVDMLKSIVNVMFAANYDQDFCEAFLRTQKEALDQYLIALGMRKLSIEE